MFLRTPPPAGTAGVLLFRQGREGFLKVQAQKLMDIHAEYPAGGRIGIFKDQTPRFGKPQQEMAMGEFSIMLRKVSSPAASSFSISLRFRTLTSILAKTKATWFRVGIPVAPADRIESHESQALLPPHQGNDYEAFYLLWLKEPPGMVGRIKGLDIGDVNRLTTLVGAYPPGNALY